MPTWNYWYRIEYRRELAKGVRVHEHTEVAEDQGWMFNRKGFTPQEWFAYYTRACAEDYLHRIYARPGTWFVSVWHTGVSREGQGEHRGTIKMKWSTKRPKPEPGL